MCRAWRGDSVGRHADGACVKCCVARVDVPVRARVIPITVKVDAFRDGLAVDLGHALLDARPLRLGRDAVERLGESFEPSLEFLWGHNGSYFAFGFSGFGGFSA